jgi:hypothetical protein
MQRIGIRVSKDEERQQVTLNLFEENNMDKSLSVSLTPDRVVQLAGNLLKAMSEMENRPSDERTKFFLQTALSSLTTPNTGRKH